MDPRRVLVGLVSSGLVLASVETQGSTWQLTPLPVDNAQVRAMALAPSQPARVYLGLTGFGVWRTDNICLSHSNPHLSGRSCPYFRCELVPDLPRYRDPAYYAGPLCLMVSRLHAFLTRTHDLHAALVHQE